jgi:hypothetical protein
MISISTSNDTTKDVCLPGLSADRRNNPSSLTLWTGGCPDGYNPTAQIPHVCGARFPPVTPRRLQGPVAVKKRRAWGLHIPSAAPGNLSCPSASHLICHAPGFHSDSSAGPLDSNVPEEKAASWGKD